MLCQQPVGLLSLSSGVEKSSPGYTHSHIAQLRLLFPLSRNQATSHTISVHFHHPAWPGNTVGFFPLLEFSLGVWSTEVSDLVLPAARAGLAPLVDFTEAFLGVKTCSANEHLLSGTLQSTRAHLNQHFCSTHSYKDVSWTGDTQWLETKYYRETQKVVLYNQDHQCPPSAFSTCSWRRDEHIPIHKELFYALFFFPIWCFSPPSTASPTQGEWPKQSSISVRGPPAPPACSLFLPR